MVHKVLLLEILKVKSYGSQGQFPLYHLLSERNPMVRMIFLILALKVKTYGS